MASRNCNNCNYAILNEPMCDHLKCLKNKKRTVPEAGSDCKSFVPKKKNKKEED